MRQRDSGGGRRWKLHATWALERKGELQSGVERCGEGRGWCSPFIGVGGAPGRRQHAVTIGVMAVLPLIAGVVKEGG
jgi:hypothetical protein